MTSLLVVFIIVALIIYLADTIFSNEGLVILVRIAAMLGLILWILNVSETIRLPIRPW